MVSMFEVQDYHDEIRDAADVLREGKVLVLPTETVLRRRGAAHRSEALYAALKSLRGSDAGQAVHDSFGKREDAEQLSVRRRANWQGA